MLRLSYTKGGTTQGPSDGAPSWTGTAGRPLTWLLLIPWPLSLAGSVPWRPRWVPHATRASISGPCCPCLPGPSVETRSGPVTDFHCHSCPASSVKGDVNADESMFSQRGLIIAGRLRTADGVGGVCRAWPLWSRCRLRCLPTCASVFLPYMVCWPLPSGVPVICRGLERAHGSLWATAGGLFN